MTEAAILFAAVFAAAVAAGFAGFAFSLLAAGVVYHLREPAAASLLLLAFSVATQAVSFARLRLKPSFGILLPLLLPAFPGIPVGLALTEVLDPAAVRRSLGIFLVLFALLMAFRWRPLVLGRAGRWIDGAVGFAGGVMGGFVGISGALPTAWVLVRDWEDATRRMAYQYYIAVIQSAALIAALATTPLPPTFAVDLVAGLPAAVAGALLGVRLYRRASADRLRRALLALLALTGLSLLP